MPEINSNLCNLIMTSLRPIKNQLRPTIESWIDQLKRISQNKNLRLRNTLSNRILISKLEQVQKLQLKMKKTTKIAT